ncbi:MAG: hypothetical protein DRZ90_00860 [Spirochaetes bacterium]|nr:MAG: hypothetical protein DRZ90_00860 [Spirochaetota bacterium]
MEQISIKPARSGEPAASIGSVHIHSIFNPEKEAQRFLDTQVEGIRQKAAVVIIGSGLGYLDRELKKKRPHSTIIAIHLDNRLYHSRIQSSAGPNPVKRWYPGSEKDIVSFLFEALSETSIRGLRILEWPASVKALPREAEQAVRALSTVIHRYSGNISTTAAFGRLWIKNTLRNYLDLQNVMVPGEISEAVVLAAAGPSLESTLDILKKYREHFQLWALPSSLPALMKANLEPQLIITTDPGYWARLHSRYFPENVPLAMPLSAAPRQNTDSPIVLISQGTPGEDYLLQNSEWPRLHLVSRGTVAATAIELWKKKSTGPLIITGLDLCWNDLRSHARPHSFDGWIASLSSRKNPINNILWERAEKLAPDRSGIYRSGPALKTYTDWFRQNLPPGRVFRLIPDDLKKSPVVIPGAPDCGPEIFRTSGNPPTVHSFSVKASPESFKEKQRKVRKLISRWKDSLESDYMEVNNETAELLYTLDPGGVLELGQSGRLEYPEIRIRHLTRVRKIINQLEAVYG